MLACVCLLSVFEARAFSGEEKGAGRCAQREQRLERWETRIGARIEHLKAFLAKHPKAPAAVTSAAHKLITDLGTLKADLDRLEAAVAAHDRAARKADHGTIRKDREVVEADRESLRAALHAWRGAHRHGQKPGTGAL